MNGAAMPSLGVIAAIGAHRSGFITAARKLVITTSVPRSAGGAAFAASSGMVPDKSADFASIAKWAGGVAGLTALAFAFGDGTLGDVSGAFLALTAFGMSITYGPDLITAITTSPKPTTPTDPTTPPAGTVITNPGSPGVPPNSTVPGFWNAFGV